MELKHRIALILDYMKPASKIARVTILVVCLLIIVLVLLITASAIINFIQLAFNCILVALAYLLKLIKDLIFGV